MTPVTLAVVDDIATITLARPDRGNAIDLPTAQALRDSVAAVAATHGIAAVVVGASGPAFCVGGDLNAFATATAPGAFIAELAGTMHEAIGGLRAMPAPVISAVHGACAGAGIGIALAADLIVADRTARFRAAYTAAGLSPDCGVSWALTRALGPARAHDLILTNRVLAAEEAERLGLISRLVESGTAGDQALDLARAMAAGPRQALARSAALVRSVGESPLTEHLAAEATSIAAMIETTDGQEGVAAFLAKRAPRFTPPDAAQPVTRQAGRATPAPTI